MADRDWERIETDFAENIRRWRERKGLSQDALAAGMTDFGFPFHQATIYKIEKGERPVRIVEALALAALLDQYLYDLIDPPEDDQVVSLKDAKAELAQAQLGLTALEVDLQKQQAEVDSIRHDLRLAERKVSNTKLSIRGQRDHIEGLRRLIKSAKSTGKATIAGGQLVQHRQED